jgi:lipid II:glycine glycyltransferase (peptidoglycan interpeptide bridge formation enzyme)
MIRFSSMAIRFGQVWFDEPIVEPLPDVLILRHCRARPEAIAVTIKHSLVSDLEQPTEEIWEKIGKTCRYKIRRAENKDGAICSVDADQSPTIAELDDFVAFYDEFARAKSLAPINRSRLLAVAEAGRLRLSRGVLNGTIVVRHAYIVTGGTVRLLYSASLFRGSSDDVRAAIGRTNRLLHWLDMQTFKRQEYRTFDWGGLFADEIRPDHRGINDFKREFGGRRVDYFEGYAACSPLGRVVLQIAALPNAARSLLRNLRFRAAKPA